MASVDFFGEQIELNDSISEWTMMEFAEAAGSADSESLAGLAAVMTLLREAVAPHDWRRFRDLAKKNRATAEQCMPVVVAVFQEQAARPTGRPSDSSGGPRVIEPSSTVGSSSPASDLLAGRPDLQLVAKRAQEARAS